MSGKKAPPPPAQKAGCSSNNPSIKKAYKAKKDGSQGVTIKKNEQFNKFKDIDQFVLQEKTIKSSFVGT
jgi:hypothetical protein